MGHRKAGLASLRAERAEANYPSSRLDRRRPFGPVLLFAFDARRAHLPRRWPAPSSAATRFLIGAAVDILRTTRLAASSAHCSAASGSSSCPSLTRHHLEVWGVPLRSVRRARRSPGIIVDISARVAAERRARRRPPRDGPRRARGGRHLGHDTRRSPAVCQPGCSPSSRPCLERRRGAPHRGSRPPSRSRACDATSPRLPSRRQHTANRVPDRAHGWNLAHCRVDREQHDRRPGGQRVHRHAPRRHLPP